MNLRRKAIASNDGMQPSLYQEAACGLVAGAAGAYLSFPFAQACQLKQADVMGAITERRWKLTSNWSHVFGNGGHWLKPRIVLGAGMVAFYNPSRHYLMESHGFSEVSAKFAAGAMSGSFAGACAQLVQLSCLNGHILKSKGPVTCLPVYFEGPRAMIFWLNWIVAEEVQNMFQNKK